MFFTHRKLLVCSLTELMQPIVRLLYHLLSSLQLGDCLSPWLTLFKGTGHILFYFQSTVCSHSRNAKNMCWVNIEYQGFPGSSLVKDSCAVQELQEMQVRSLCQEDPLEEGMAIHSSILAWRIPWTEEPGRLQSKGSQRVGHNWSDVACIVYQVKEMQPKSLTDIDNI